MTDTKRLTALAAGLFGTTMLVSAGGACAQAAAQSASSAPPTTTSTISEVVVTAEKRSESLQKVPISMQALTPEVLERHQVQTFDDYSKLLPSVSFQSLGPGLSTLSFRGIFSGKDGNASNSLPTSGVYLDEVPVTTIGALVDVHIYDVARVEALAGPQGTLYGASSLAGTMRIITNKPDPSRVSAGYDLQLNKYGSGDPGGTAEGFVNVPLNDRVALRLVGFYEHDGGYIDNVLGSRTYNLPHTVNGAVVTSPLTINNSDVVKNNFNDVTIYGGRAALGIELNDDWTITPSLVAQELSSNGTFLYDPKVGDLKVHDFIDGNSYDRWYQAALTVAGKVKDWNVLYSGARMRRHNYALADYSYYDVAYDTVPDSIYFQKLNGDPLNPNQYVSRDYQFTKDTHEFRVSSPSGERLQATMGLFYQRQQNNYVQNYIVPGSSATLQAAKLVVTGDDQFITRFLRIDRDYAAYAQVDFKITPDLTLTGGIRGFRYDNSLAGFTGTAGGARKNCPGAVYTPSCLSVDKTAKGSGETHKVSLTWQIDPAKMVYATYSTGFRPGGINRPAGFAPYAPDTLDNYEVGWKTELFERRVRFNGSAYYEEWKGVQYSLPGANGVSSIVNAGNAVVKGVEADFVARLGAWDLSAAADYNDARLTTDFCNMTNGVPHCELGLFASKGTVLPVQPHFKGTATARFNFDLADHPSYAQLALTNRGKATTFLRTRDNTAIGDTPGFTTLDFALGGKFWDDARWEFFVQNLFDKRGELSRNSQCVLLTCYQHGRVYPVKPQLFGIKVGQSF